jgi:hypothetical protein
MAKYGADAFAEATAEHRAADFDLRFQNFGINETQYSSVWAYARLFNALLGNSLSGWLSGILKTLADYFSFGKYH